ncbi:hypothetical protein [Flavobacterium sp.]|uniref:hypothetical protein n=1 Tax=Flavobacterium sp. TaxID=239 RepID=UPI0025D66479|nr:hypothetical protein [Flavobacterium sp.]
MFTLFKRRNFGDYVSDTFVFFKENGKHYFKNYFTISGPMLLILVATSYFLFQVYFDFFLKIDPNSNNSEYLESYLANNMPMVVLVALGLLLFMILISMLSYAIPVIYFDLYQKNNGKSFGTKEILSQFKANFGKILVFFLVTIFLITPLLMVVFTLLFLLCFIIVGIPLILFAIPTAFCWVTLSFYEYLNTDKGVFQSYGNGFKHLTKQYFPIVGSCMVIYIIIQVTMTIFTMIPYMFGLISFFTTTEDGINNNNAVSGLTLIMTVVMVFSLLMSYILNNLLLVNQGVVFYSRQEFDENKSADFSIDLIGSE